MDRKYIEFLTHEMGECYEDLIELDFNMTVEEFVEAFIREDDDGTVWSEI